MDFLGYFEMGIQAGNCMFAATNDLGDIRSSEIVLEMEFKRQRHQVHISGCRAFLPKLTYFKRRCSKDLL